MTVAAKRKPVRAIPQAILRKAWSEGHTYYPPKRAPMYAEDKPLEEQSLDEMCGGDMVKVMNDLAQGKRPEYGEPTRESRRSWLQTGFGVLSLELRQLFGDEGDQVELIDFAMSDPERNAQMYRFTPYVGVDPNMQRAIIWEQTASQNGDSVTVQIIEDDQGQPTLRVKGWGFRTHADFLRAAKQILKTIRHKAELVNRFSSAYAAEENWRWTSPSHDEWHTAFESYGPEEDAIPGEPWVLKRVVLRRPKHFDPGYDLWHAQGRDQVERELGTDLISDPMLEELLGIKEWDEEGNPCVS